VAARPVPQQADWGPPRQTSWAKRLLVGLFVSLFIVSLLFNLSMLLLLGLAAGQDGGLRTTVLEDGARDQTIAVFSVEGAIDGRTSDDFARFFRQIDKDKDIRAVVLRVNSPGGTVSDSDEIHHFVSRIKQKGLPVVVSMGGVAASGGYYISAGANEIFAEPTTITGSIGVIGSWPVVHDLLNNHGVQMVMIRSRQARGTKATENPFEKPSDRTLQNMETMLTAMHDKFEQVVRDGRGTKLTLSTIDVEITVPTAEGPAKQTVQQTEPLNGQVYLAEDAKNNGLVDEIGYLNDAIDSAAVKARLDKRRVVHYSRPLGLFSVFNAKTEAAIVPEPTKLLDDLSTPRILMMWKMEN